MDVERMRLDSESEGHNPWAATLEAFEEIAGRLDALDGAGDGAKLDVYKLAIEEMATRLQSLEQDRDAILKAHSELLRDIPRIIRDEVEKALRAAPAADIAEPGDGKKKK